MKKLLFLFLFISFVLSSYAPTCIAVNEKNGEGNVSWYGPGFHGKLTANGERFNENKLTAAHKTLKFGTKVRVKNPKNGKSVVVRINDRGPFVKGRVFDLSKAAFQKIASIDSGVIRVQYEIL